jgi:hypothetical protein
MARALQRISRFLDESGVAYAANYLRSFEGEPGLRGTTHDTSVRTRPYDARSGDRETSARNARSGWNVTTQLDTRKGQLSPIIHTGTDTSVDGDSRSASARPPLPESRSTIAWAACPGSPVAERTTTVRTKRAARFTPRRDRRQTSVGTVSRASGRFSRLLQDHNALHVMRHREHVTVSDRSRNPRSDGISAPWKGCARASERQTSVTAQRSRRRRVPRPPARSFCTGAGTCSRRRRLPPHGVCACGWTHETEQVAIGHLRNAGGAVRVQGGTSPPPNEARIVP